MSMQKILDHLKREYILIGMFKGAVTGLVLWIFHLVIYRAVGVDPVLYRNIADLIFAGAIIGSIIGIAVSTVKISQQK